MQPGHGPVVSLEEWPKGDAAKATNVPREDEDGSCTSQGHPPGGVLGVGLGGSQPRGETADNTVRESAETEAEAFRDADEGDGPEPATDVPKLDEVGLRSGIALHCGCTRR